MELRPAFRVSGFYALVLLLIAAAAGLALAIGGLAAGTHPSDPAHAAAAAAGIALIAVTVVLASGLTVVGPNEARVLQFFGRYIGSVDRPGLSWVTPLTEKRRVSLRIRNFETQKLKVNDADGNPIEIAAVIAFRVVDSFKAAFAVDNYEDFTHTQSETAVRHLATSHPYQSAGPDTISLRDGAAVVGELTGELRERTAMAGIEIVEARITHLAYAPEIAQAMLVRQQAEQVVAARTRIVEGAVGMVGLALDRLAEQGVVDLDDERKAAMASNLLVVLCGDRAASPVVNTGTLYS
ncbi:SPFH domain-containing protein [Nocardia stercoris]|uniref:SPFH domain-containing protein n=1 Tax=Nocardia stercoris TaxID=2483361 RepID=A0A3M2L7N4_9NOCA|nr:SPFH domain-containing protein [Nocardia stercoris]RMI33639.1 SPFH domain-containing protein [Nocardia stercoris]